MKIVVFIRQVIDVGFPFELNPDTCEISADDIFYIVNPADLCAAEAAVKIKETFQSQIIFLSFGPLRVEDALRKCMALGGDEAIHIIGEDANTDSRIISRALSVVIRKLSPDIVFCGSRSFDLNEAEIPGFLSGWLDLPQLTGVMAFQVSSDLKSIRAERKLERGKRMMVESPLPVVISIEPGSEKSRYPNLPDLMRAISAKITRIDLRELESEGPEIKGGPANKLVGYSLPRPRPKKLFTFNSDLSADDRLEMLMSGSVEKRKTNVIEGNPAELAEKLEEIIKVKGGLCNASN